MATSAVLIHTSNENHNSESVNTHINIRPVVISEQLLTVNMITIIVFTKI